MNHSRARTQMEGEHGRAGRSGGGDLGKHGIDLLIAVGDHGQDRRHQNLAGQACLDDGPDELRRALGVGVPGSSAVWMVSSIKAIETPILTDTALLATASSGRSRPCRGALGQDREGVPDPVSAAMIPGMRR